MTIHHLIRTTRLLLLTLCLVLLAACDTDPGLSGSVDSDGGASLAITKPAFIGEARAIDPSRLELSVSLNNEPVMMNCNPAQTCTGGTEVAVNTEYTLIARWNTVEGLPLAEASVTFSVPADRSDFTVVIADEDYDTVSFDADADGTSNLAELDAGTDPMVPDNTVVQVPVNFVFELPAALTEAGDDALANVSAVATVSQRPLLLTRDGNLWSGTSTAARGGEIFIRATFYASANRLVTLAVQTRTQAINSDSVTVRFLAGAYETAFNSDGDALTNSEEIVGGTNPLDAADPAQDPCEISQFQPGCDVDTDNDGKPDSVEGINADSDGDNIPDYRESAIEDADGDGVVDEDDPANNNPCVPDTDSAACDQPPPDPCATSNFAAGCTTDTDADGVPDSEEGQQSDSDNDGIPDYLESAVADADNDGVVDQDDPANSDACVPDTDNAACDQPPPDPCATSNFATGCTTDTDADGVPDSVEGQQTDSDGDGIADYLESAVADADSDGIPDQEDPANINPCSPDSASPACDQPPPDPCASSNFATGCETDSDGDGKPDSVETETADEDSDGIPDYLDSATIDTDDDAVNDELDPDNTDPCVPDTTALACEPSADDTPQADDTPETDTPSTDTPATGTPGTGTPATGKPATDTPGNGTSDTATPGTGTPGTGTPGTGAPGTDTPATDRPGGGAPAVVRR